MHYNRHRYYDPENGRYITRDPIGFTGGLNLYAYTQNPLKDTDFLGLHGKQAEEGERDSEDPTVRQQFNKFRSDQLAEAKTKGKPKPSEKEIGEAWAAYKKEKGIKTAEKSEARKAFDKKKKQSLKDEAERQRKLKRRNRHDRILGSDENIERMKNGENPIHPEDGKPIPVHHKTPLKYGDTSNADCPCNGKDLNDSENFTMHKPDGTLMTETYHEENHGPLHYYQEQGTPNLYGNPDWERTKTMVNANELENKYIEQADEKTWKEMVELYNQSGSHFPNELPLPNGEYFQIFQIGNEITPSAPGIVLPEVCWGNDDDNIVPAIVKDDNQKEKLIEKYSELKRLTSTKLPGTPEGASGEINQTLDESKILSYGYAAIPALFYQLLFNKDEIIQFNTSDILLQIDCEVIAKISASHIQTNDRSKNLEQCMYLIGDLGKAEYFDLIFGKLDDKNLQQSAINVLAIFEDKRAIPALIGKLGVDDVGFSAAEALVDVKGYDISIPKILNLLSTGSDQVRTDASYALFSIAIKYNQIPLESILPFLNDSVPKVRERIANTIRELNDPVALPALKIAAKDKDKSVREAASKAILNISGK